MNKAELRKELMTLLNAHDNQEIKFVDCEGCESCERIKQVGNALWGLKESNFPSFFKRFFDKNGSRITYREACDDCGLSVHSATYYRYKQLYLKGKLDEVC